MTGVGAINPFAAFQPNSGTVKRLVGSTQWVSAGQWSFDLPRGQDINAWIVEVTGTITLSSAATTVSAAAPAQLISQITIKADAAKSLEDISGLQAACSNFERSLARNLTAPGTGATTHTVYASYRLDRVTPDTVRPKDSALHTSQNYMGSLQMRLQFGTVAACYSNFGTGVVSATALTVNVYSVEIQEATRMAMSEFKWIRRHTSFDQTFSAAVAAQLIQLPTNTYLRGIKILALASATNEPTDGLLNNVRLRSGPNIRADIPGATLHVDNQTGFNLQTTQLSAIPGNYMLDLLEGNIGNRSLKSLWSLQAASDCTLELNIAANTRILVQSINYDMQPALPTAARLQAAKGQAAVRRFLGSIAARAARS